VDATTRLIIGLLLLFIVQMLLGPTVVFIIRRRRGIQPAWSWLKTLGAFLLLSLVVSGVGLVPVAGRFAAVIVSLIGLKRISGLDLLSTFILSFFMGLSVFVIAAVISQQLQVDLLGLP
jgi:hypothetical protein